MPIATGRGQTDPRFRLLCRRETMEAFAHEQSQIGLQLRNKKLAIPALVVDSIEKKLMEN